MSAVNIYRRLPDTEVEHLATVVGQGRRKAALVQILVPELAEGLGGLLEEGIFDDRGRFLTPADGDAFVNALPAFFHGSRFWAEEVLPPPDQAADETSPA